MYSFLLLVVCCHGVSHPLLNQARVCCQESQLRRVQDKLLLSDLSLQLRKALPVQSNELEVRPCQPLALRRQIENFLVKRFPQNMNLTLDLIKFLSQALAILFETVFDVALDSSICKSYIIRSFFVELLRYSFDFIQLFLVCN